MALVPLLLRDGRFDEAEVPGSRPSSYFRRRVGTDVQIYDLMEFYSHAAYASENYRMTVSVYVDTRFAPGRPYLDRRAAANVAVQANAAWVFSYGHREWSRESDRERVMREDQERSERSARNRAVRQNHDAVDAIGYTMNTLVRSDEVTPARASAGVDPDFDLVSRAFLQQALTGGLEGLERQWAGVFNRSDPLPARSDTLSAATSAAEHVDGKTKREPKKKVEDEFEFNPGERRLSVGKKEKKR